MRTSIFPSERPLEGIIPSGKRSIASRRALITVGRGISPRGHGTKGTEEERRNRMNGAVTQRRRRLIKLTLSEINNRGASRDPRCIMSSPSDPSICPPSWSSSNRLLFEILWVVHRLRCWPIPARYPVLATHFIATFRPLDYFTLYDGPLTAETLLRSARRIRSFVRISSTGMKKARKFEFHSTSSSDFSTLDVETKRGNFIVNE